MHDKKEDQATAEFGIDEFTRLLIYKMINNQILERVNGVISIGKYFVFIFSTFKSEMYFVHSHVIRKEDTFVIRHV